MQEKENLPQYRHYAITLSPKNGKQNVGVPIVFSSLSEKLPEHSPRTISNTTQTLWTEVTRLNHDRLVVKLLLRRGNLST
jgi:hypothetical protein